MRSSRTPSLLTRETRHKLDLYNAGLKRRRTSTKKLRQSLENTRKQMLHVWTISRVIPPKILLGVRFSKM
jgi:hypothetical protein